MKRYSNNYQIQLSYTLSRAMDNGDAQVSTDTIASAIYRRIRTIWARSGGRTVDTPHVFAANATWELPSRNNRLLAGWQLNGSWRCTPLCVLAFDQTPNWSRTGNISNNAEDRPT